MDILFVMPYPPSRIRVRGYSFIQQLRQEHSITILTQVTSQQERRDVEFLQQQGYEVVAVAASRPRALWQSGCAILSGMPLQAAYARSSLFVQHARKLHAQRHFDIMHVEHLRGMASMEDLLPDHRLVWDAVDCISQLWKQTSVAGSSILTRTIASLEYARTARYEQSLIRRCAHTVTISEVERQALLALPAGAGGVDTMPGEITVIPNGVDLTYFSPLQQEYQAYNIVFSGKMSYHANVSAVHYLYTQIMPLIWQEQPAATLTIVGSKPPRSIQALAADARVIVTGYVDDIRPYIRRAHIMLCPMLYSVGLQNKVLEAMALGVPTVISVQSAGALAALAGHDMLVASSAQEFAERALLLMQNANLRMALSLNGRTYVERYHDWRLITARLVHLYQRASVNMIPTPVAVCAPEIGKSSA